MTVARRLALVGALAGALTLAACLPSVEQVAPDDSMPWPDGGSHPSSGGSLEELYTQELEWTTCDDFEDFECATIQVPLDWSDPSGTWISLALNRSPARLPEERLGSLLINPGGPGGSGLRQTSDIVMGGGDRLLDHYDIVGFDPRGVGQSTPVECGTDAELDDYFLRDEIISTEAELTAAIEQTADFAERCRELTGALIENVDTASAARDMDVIRAVLGEERLNFLGMSYGTQLGAVYAALFPENVGRMVLDGAFDFLLPSEDISMGQARGFEQALEAYIADCLTSEDCPLPQDPELARRTIQEMLDTARDEGIPSYRGDVNGTVLLYGIFVPLYIGETWWPDLSDSIAEYLDRGTAREFQYLSDTFYIGRDEEGHYLDNTQEAFTAISCLDTPSSPEVSITEFRDFRRDAEEASPTFGWWFGSNTGCEGWPFTPDEIVTDLTPTASAPPIVVIGTTGDPATPVEWAESLAERMPTASLVIYTGEGHLAYLTANPCIVDAVDSYFVDDTVPASGLTC